MKIQQIYDKYQIMPNLQEHMLRVAGVASIICDNYTKPVNKSIKHLINSFRNLEIK